MLAPSLIFIYEIKTLATRGEKSDIERGDLSFASCSIDSTKILKIKYEFPNLRYSEPEIKSTIST